MQQSKRDLESIYSLQSFKQICFSVTMMVVLVFEFGFFQKVVLAQSIVTHTDADKYLNLEPSETNSFPPDEFEKRLGAIPETSQATDSDESALPFKVDQNYPDFFVIPPDKRPPIMDQGSCGSCVAWASSTALATMVANKKPRYASFIPALYMPNPMSLFLGAGRRCDPGMPNLGWYANKGLARLAQVGVFVAIATPAKNTGFAESTKMTRLKGWFIKAEKSDSLTNKDAMRKFIATQGALVANFDVYPGFNRYKHGIYNHDKFVEMLVKPFKNEEIGKLSSAAAKNFDAAAETVEKNFNTRSGGHAVTVIGYFKGGTLKLRDYMRPILPPNADLSAYGDIELPQMPAFWIIQNSWGKDWGMNGLFYIEENQVGIDDKMYYSLNPKITVNGKEIL